MKLFESQHKFNHPWSHVTAANWLKYPNDLRPDIVQVDYLSRELDPVTGVLRTERLMTCRQHMPALLVRLLGGKPGDEQSAYIHEVSYVDPRNKTMTLQSRNLTLNHLMSVDERCYYAAHPSLPRTTIFKQEAQISAGSGFSFLKHKLEELCLGTIQINSQKGRAALEQAVERLNGFEC